MQRSIFFIIGFIFLAISGITQETGWTHNESPRLEGKVFVQDDGTLRGLQGVRVSIMTGSESAITQEDGTFSLEWPGEACWIGFNYPGYAEKEIRLNEPGILEIVLHPENNRSADQQLPGPFGEVRKFKNTSFSYISGDRIELSAETNFETGLQGKLPGITSRDISGLPGQGSILGVRGLHSLFAVEQPLVIVDGIPAESRLLTSQVTPGAVYNPLSAIDLSDIESIELYRDGTPLYGFRGNQGIIRVSTSQPEVVNTDIKFSVYSGLTFQPAFIPLLNSVEYKTYLLNLLQDSGMKPGDISRQNPWISGNPSYYYYYDYANNTNWQDEVMQAARINKYNVSLQGGDEIARFSVSLGYLDHEGVVINSGFQRYNFRLNSRLQILQGLSMEANLGYSYHVANLVNGSADNSLNPLNAALLKPPMLAPNLRDNLGNQISLLGDTDAFGFSNPVAIVQNVEAGRFGSDLFAGTRLNYSFSSSWDISSAININYTNLKENTFIPDHGIADFQDGEIKNIAKEGISKLNGLVSETRLNYRTDLNQEHFIRAYTGFRATTFSLNYNEGNAFNTPTDEFKSLSSVSSIENTLIFGNNRRENRSEWLVYGDYRYQDRFLAGLVLNLAGTSNAGSTADALNLFGGKFGFFPALNLAWLASSENFLKNIKGLDLLKLRTSISWTGNDFYTVYNRFSYMARPYGSNSAIVRDFIPNPGLKWETTRQINAGLDLAMWRERFQLGVDVYQHHTTDLLTFRELPAEAGNAVYWENNGSLSTLGTDIEMSTLLINRKQLKLTLGVIGSFHRSSLALTEDLIIQTPSGQIMLADGEVPYAFYGLQTNGIYTDGESAVAGGLVNDKGLAYQAGDIRFVDQNGDGRIDAGDEVILGSVLPDYDGGFYLDLAFWRFHLSVYTDFMVGNKLFNYQRYLLESQTGYANQGAASLYSWKYDGFETDIPRAVFGDPSGNNAFSDRWIEDGSYFRVRQLTLSYQFPENKIYRSLRLYLTGTNLLTLSRYLGYHPVFSYSADPILWGTDFGQTPISPAVVLGVKLDL
jgi:TonB-linked SusC/RagA family outer membrane protein